MPRRRVLTEAQLDALLALPMDDAVLVRHWMLGADDLAAIGRRRRDRNQLGFAIQLCALRYPGRLPRPGELIPGKALRFVAEQLGVEPEALSGYAARFQTRYEQAEALRKTFGFGPLDRPNRRELLAWLVPIALATTAHKLIRNLSSVQGDALDALLQIKEGTPMSVLAWSRQPPGAPGHRALARVVEQRAALRAIALDPNWAEGVHPERFRKLAREGARFTAQHLRALSTLRRRATLVATALDTITRPTDDGVSLFDRAVGRMFRRAEVREQDALLRNARAINDKVRLLAKLGGALIEARNSGADLDKAVAAAIGWDKLARNIEEAECLARPDKADLPALAARAWPVLHRLGPLFLGAFQLRAVPAAAATLRGVELLREAYASSGRKWARHPPTSFLRATWRDAVWSSGELDRRTWEAATLLALRDRLRAGDIWVEDSRQWRAVEDQLIPPPLFAAMREAGPFPVAAPATPPA